MLRLWCIGTLLCALALTPRPAAAAETITLPDGPDRALVYGSCQTCHDLQYLKESAGIDREDWSAILDAMHQYGMRIPAERQAKILDYLATYLGDTPPPAAAASTAAAPPANGGQVFTEQCAACHQPTGLGLAGYFPPLAGNPDLFHDRTMPVHVVLGGLAGPITVKSQSYNGAMPSFAHLPDAEIAAVINYVRGAWGNTKLLPAGTTPIDAATVAAVRAGSPNAESAHAYRAAHP